MRQKVTIDDLIKFVQVKNGLNEFKEAELSMRNALGLRIKNQIIDEDITKSSATKFRIEGQGTSTTEDFEGVYEYSATFTTKTTKKISKDFDYEQLNKLEKECIDYTIIIDANSLSDKQVEDFVAAITKLKIPFKEDFSLRDTKFRDLDKKKNTNLADFVTETPATPTLDVVITEI